MKLVIDCSALELPELEVFLARTSRNTAVLTDVCANEAFGRGDYAVALHKTLAQHPGQVLVLKNTRTIAELKPRSKGLLHRLVNKEETADFPKYASLLVGGSDPLRQRLPEKQKRAREYLDNLLPLSEDVRAEFKNVIADFSGCSVESLKALRRDGRVEEDLLRAIAKAAARWTKGGLAQVGISKLPALEDVKFGLPFRIAVCQAALAIHWARKGGLDTRIPEKLRNDMIDCAVSAYATFFDGLLTDDNTLRDVHKLARDLLRETFRVRLP